MLLQATLKQENALFAEAAKLGVPSIQVPVEWAKMEIEKDGAEDVHEEENIVEQN